MYSIAMDAPSQEELESIRAAGQSSPSDSVVHWQSAFGLVIIEVRDGRVFVNGDLVEPVGTTGTWKRRGAGVVPTQFGPEGSSPIC